MYFFQSNLLKSKLFCAKQHLPIPPNHHHINRPWWHRYPRIKTTTVKLGPVWPASSPAKMSAIQSGHWLKKLQPLSVTTPPSVVVAALLIRSMTWPLPSCPCQSQHPTNHTSPSCSNPSGQSGHCTPVRLTFYCMLCCQKRTVQLLTRGCGCGVWNHRISMLHWGGYLGAAWCRGQVKVLCYRSSLPA